MRHKLSLDVNYVHDWTLQDALRELFQNAIDHGDWTWLRDNDRLTIISKGAELPKRTLLLGRSEKADGSIGKWGEGYKLALLVLTRLGHECYIDTGYELWTPKLIDSRTYGTKQLVIDTEVLPTAMHHDSLFFIIDGLSDDDWTELSERNLHLRKPAVLHCTSKGDILDEEEAGRLYVGGLFVCELEGLKYGYNFKPTEISLDRDRRLLRSFDVQWLTSEMWIATDDVEVTKRLVQEEVADVRYLEQQLPSYKKSIAEAVAEDFVAEHGEDAVPVSTESERQLAEHQGHEKIVIVPKTVNTLIRRAPSWSPPAVAARVVNTPYDKMKEFYLKHKDDMGYASDKAFVALMEEARTWRTTS